MGCFLGCFGSSKDRKRRKQRYKAIRPNQNPKDQNLVKDDVSLVQNASNSLSELRGKIQEPLNLSTRKKVTFDANVTTYEHVQEVYDGTGSLLERNEKDETFPKSGQTDSHSDSQVMNVGSYPPDYRYGNCLGSDDEVEDFDDEDEIDEGLDYEEDYDDEEVWCESIPTPIPSPESRVESSLNPVLKPVENLTQWKALKSVSPLISNPEKENSSLNSIPFPPKNRNQETAVDASLSKWLVSSEKNTPDSKHVEPVSSGKGYSQESRKSSGRSPDDMPIIGSVGSYWSQTGSAQSLSSTSSYKGIPNTTSKYREDKKVNWHNTPFETRLERALKRNAAE